MLRIYYTNLGLYNEGILSGEWIDLPASDEEIENVRNRTGYDEAHEEYFITDYETDINNLKVEEFDSIEELNALAELIEDDPEVVEALLYFGYDTAAEIEDEKDNVMYITTCGSFEDMHEAVGRHYADECLNIPENIEMYFDYEAYGRDICLEGQFYEADNGSIYEYIR